MANTIITAGHEESAFVQIRAHHQLLVIAEEIGIIQRVIRVFDEEILVHHRIEAEILPTFDDVVLGFLQSAMRKSPQEAGGGGCSERRRRRRRRKENLERLSTIVMVMA